MYFSSLSRRSWLWILLSAARVQAQQPPDDLLGEEERRVPSAHDGRTRAAPPPLSDAPPPSVVAEQSVSAVAEGPLEQAPSEAAPAHSKIAPPTLKRPSANLQARMSPRYPGVRIEAVHAIAVQRIPEAGPHLFAPLAHVEVAGTPYYPYSFDGHVHSQHSPDAAEPVLDMLAGAERAGLSALVFTDHGSARSQLSFAKYKGPVKAFVGQEIGGEYGHAVWWNVDAALPYNPSRATLSERAAIAHEHGGLIVLCHPGWWIGGRERDPMQWITPEALKKGGLSGDIDALELWNGVYDKPLPKLIAAWVEALEAGVYVPIVGNSDFHRFRSHRLGGPRNVVLCDKPDPATCMWSAIKAGRSYVTDGPTLDLRVNGKTFGEQVAHGPLDVSIDTTSPRGGELRLYVGRELVKAWSLRPAVREQFTWSGPGANTPSYVRIEIVRSIAGYEAPVFELLSNPVFTR